ncbi:MAG TPA: helix-turn-helix domain-containing protein [Solirubrobacteraceae bacterium]|jgi:hypothetical protein
MASEHEARAERERLLAPLLADVDGLAARGLAALRAELPAYAGQSDQFFADVLDQLRRNYTTILNALIEERELTAQELGFQRGASMRRARAGFALEDYVSAYRVGTRVMWDAIGEVAEGDSVDYRTVLALAASVMRSNHFATTHAGEAYVEFRQHGLADVAKERRDLLERLLEGALPESGALAAAAERYGLGAAVPVLVAVALPLGAGSDPDASLLASATLARAGLQDPASLVVVRHAEIVSIFGLAAGRDPDQVCVRLEQAQQRIRREGTSLAIGVSTIAKGIAELPNAYREAVAAVRFVGKEGGVAALTRLTQFEYLALNADATTRRLIDPRVQAFLDDDNRRGGALVATIRAYAEADLSLKRAGALLHVHTNTARYRLDRIEELTGLTPRRFKDLQALLVAIAVNDA